MTARFAVAEFTALTDQFPWLLAHGTRVATLRTGRLWGQGLGLEFKEGRERALGQAAGSGRGDLFQGEEVQFQEFRSRSPKGAACDNFAPLGGEVTDVVELLGS